MYVQDDDVEFEEQRVGATYSAPSRLTMQQAPPYYGENVSHITVGGKTSRKGTMKQKK